MKGNANKKLLPLSGRAFYILMKSLFFTVEKQFESNSKHGRGLCTLVYFLKLCHVRIISFKTVCILNRVNSHINFVSGISLNPIKCPSFIHPYNSVIRIDKKITIIENELYQTKNRSGQDPLNFPIKLNNKLSSVGSGVFFFSSRRRHTRYGTQLGGWIFGKN